MRNIMIATIAALGFALPAQAMQPVSVGSPFSGAIRVQYYSEPYQGQGGYTGNNYGTVQQPGYGYRDDGYYGGNGYYSGRDRQREIDREYARERARIDEQREDQARRKAQQVQDAQQKAILRAQQEALKMQLRAQQQQQNQGQGLSDVLRKNIQDRNGN